MSTVTDPHTDEHNMAASEQAHDTPADTTTCPNCGAPADRGQLMCLECGNRLALGYRRPPGWRLLAAIVGAVLLIAGLGLAVALTASTNDASKTTAAAPPPPAQSTPQPAPSAPADTAPTASTPTPAPTPSNTTTTPAPAGGTPSATPTGTAPTPAPPPSTSSGWPPGKSAFTVILASMPSRSAADAKLKKAQAAGISGAAILHSDDFPTLKPGYWVVFDGQYDSMAQAQSQGAADGSKSSDFADWYPRYVSKDANAKP
jgi:cell division septation protein DedD